MQPHFQIYPERHSDGLAPLPTGLWRWRFLAANGENTANGSEGYASVPNARRAIMEHIEHVFIAAGVPHVKAQVLAIDVVEE